MNSLHPTTNQHVKRKHLSFEEQFSSRGIALERWLLFACNSPWTKLFSFYYQLWNQAWYHEKVKKYKVTQEHDVYQAHRKNCGRKSDFLKKTQFIHYVHKHFFEDGWSLDVCSNRATAAGEFASSDVVYLRQDTL